MIAADPEGGDGDGHVPPPHGPLEEDASLERRATSGVATRPRALSPMLWCRMKLAAVFCSNTRELSPDAMTVSVTAVTSAHALFTVDTLGIVLNRK